MKQQIIGKYIDTNSLGLASMDIGGSDRTVGYTGGLVRRMGNGDVDNSKLAWRTEHYGEWDYPMSVELPTISGNSFNWFVEVLNPINGSDDFTFSVTGNSTLQGISMEDIIGNTAILLFSGVESQTATTLTITATDNINNKTYVSPEIAIIPAQIP